MSGDDVNKKTTQNILKMYAAEINIIKHKMILELLQGKCTWWAVLESPGKSLHVKIEMKKPTD